MFHWPPVLAALRPILCPCASEEGPNLKAATGKSQNPESLQNKYPGLRPQAPAANLMPPHPNHRGQLNLPLTYAELGNIRKVSQMHLTDVSKPLGVTSLFRLI